MGVNVPGKPQVFLPYPGGVDEYRAACDEVVERDYLGFALGGPAGTDGQRRDHPRHCSPMSQVLLDTMAELGLPPIESMSVEDARAFMDVSGAMSPPGPEVGEVVDGTLPGRRRVGTRLPALPTGVERPTPDRRLLPRRWMGARQPHVRRRRCAATCAHNPSAIFVSVNYRHAPEARFPAAADDGLAAVTWIAEHAEELGGVPGQLAVAGWSAGANVAAVTCQQAKLAGGPVIVGQVLLNPVTDCDSTPVHTSTTPTATS